MSKTYKTKQQMYRDLMAAYRKTVDKYECHDQSEAFYRTINSSAPRFYVSPVWAGYVIAPLFSGDDSRIRHMKPLHQEMFRELFKVVLKLSGKLQFQGKSLHYIMPFAVQQPAPKFYVTVWMMYKIFKNRKQYDSRTRILLKRQNDITGQGNARDNRGNMENNPIPDSAVDVRD